MMAAILILLVIFAGVTAIVYVDNTTRAGRRALKGAARPDALPDPWRTADP
ncbi:hypothetical protein ACFQDE_01590 [Deinococcus caeni]|uniref:hypothetical protein n=1 Tax=Deinococcus caeni TaxID=569127 RepID=UPI003611FA42